MPDKPNSIGPSNLGFLEKHLGPGYKKKIFGTKKDVQLPQEGKKKDPRLRTKADDIKEGYDIFKNLGK